MLPIVFDGSKLRVGIAGSGEGLQRRLMVLATGGVTEPHIFAGRRPSAEELGGLTLLFVAGLDPASSRLLADAARQAGVLINVEDVPELCDFHVPAQVRRGDLVFTVSTTGRSPALSRVLREELERRFGPEWDARLDEIADLRKNWRAQGASPVEVSENTRRVVSERGWLG